MKVCECSCSVEFDLDGGYMLNIATTPQDSPESFCEAFDVCLYSATIENAESYENGRYKGVFHSYTESSFNGELTEYDGEAWIDSLELIKIDK